MAIAFAGELRQLVGLGIVFRLRCQPLRNAPLGGRRGSVHKRLRVLGRGNPCRAVKDKGGTDIGLLQQHLRSEEHTSELQSLMRISYAVFCLKKKNNK